MRVILLALYLTATFSTIRDADGCSMPKGWVPPTIVDTVMWQGNLVVATVKRRISTLSSTSYSVELEVLCNLRGPRTKALLNATGAGYEPGLCYSANLEVNKTYIIRLDDDNKIQPPAISEEHFDEAFKACKLNKKPTYPFGKSKKKSDFRCPARLSKDKCKKH